jgi:hypothetical protein
MPARGWSRITPHLLLALGLSSAAACAQQPPAEQPAPGGDVAQPRGEEVREFKTADALLDALETADKLLRSLRAGVQYAKTFADIEGGDKQIWRGELFFDVAPAKEKDNAGDQKAEEPKRRFAVIFDKLLVGQVARDETKHLIFDGEWFVERNESAKQFSKRRVVRPGERMDPLKLGEGPFPLPIGQKKAHILSLFKAELLPYTAGLEDESESVRERFADTVQLRLTPIGKTREARDFAEVRIWYRRSDLLPRLARTRTAEGSTSEVLLIQHEVNKAIEKKIFNTDPPRETGWNIDIRDDFRPPADQPEPQLKPENAKPEKPQ